MEKFDFQKHPSIQLNELYKNKSYQGAHPHDAKILFVGRDPNWAFDVESKEMFGYVNEYLTDGIKFWNTYNIHHPFLLPTYKGDGKRYHKIFSKLNLNNSYSDKISFVELIGFPTTGMAKKSNKVFLEYLVSDANKKHLNELENLINNSDKTVFIAWGLIEDFKFINNKTGLFSKFAKLNKNEMDINDLNRSENIFIHRHFSDAIRNSTIEKMSQVISYLSF
jgi:hypothetical protein